MNQSGSPTPCRKWSGANRPSPSLDIPSSSTMPRILASSGRARTVATLSRSVVRIARHAWRRGPDTGVYPRSGMVATSSAASTQ